jgi:hypothetical protein
MSNVITVSTTYMLSAVGVVDLSPKSWHDVDDWFIKWDHLHIKFKDEEGWREFDINSDTYDGVDWKRPGTVDIYAGNQQFDDELACSS